MSDQFQWSGNTLHEAIRFVLAIMPENTGSTQKISWIIQEKTLYRKKDGGFPEDWQLYLRAKRHPEMFEIIDRNTIQLILDRLDE